MTKRVKLTALACAAAVLAAVLGICCLLHAAPGTPESGTEREKTEYADREIAELISGSAYRDGSPRERRALAGEALDRLARDGYIAGLSYDEPGDMYAFQYADGSLGGLALTDFGASSGGLPMN